MKVIVGVLDDAFLNQQRFDHSGAVICYREKDGTPTVMVPGNPKKGVKTIHLDFVDGIPAKGIESLEGHLRIKINVKSCRFFMFQDITFGFVFKEGDKTKLFSLFLAAVSTSDTERPEVAFRRFFSGLDSKNKHIYEIGSSKKMRTFLFKQGCGSNELGNYWKEQNHLVLKSKKFVLLAALLRFYMCVLLLLLVFLGKKPRRSTSEPDSSASRRCPRVLLLTTE